LAPLSQPCISRMIHWSRVIRPRTPKLGKRRQVAALQRLRRFRGISLVSIGKGTVVIVFLCAGAMLATRSAGGQKSDSAESLPEGAGRTLILQACVQCHDFKSIVSQRKTREAWRRTVNEMIWRGAPLLGDEAEVITNYLAAAFGPDAPVPKAAARTSGEK